MGTTVTYNGVVLFNIHTREWIQEVRYDESGTDAMFNVFRMRFEGLLHAGPSGSITGVTVAGAAGSMIEQYSRVHETLLKPRGTLVIETSNGGDPDSDPDSQPEEMFRCDPCPGDITNLGTYLPAAYASLDRDVDAGPKPKSLQILQVIGAKCLRVAFEIECAKLVCAGTYAFNGAKVDMMPSVLSNRWSIEEAMDENQFMTRTISGRMRLSTPVASNNPLVALAQKRLVVPGLERGFRRASVNYSVNPTGMVCEYRVVDRQVHSAAPWPATKMNVRYTQSTRDGLNMTSEVQVELEGPPYASKKALFGRAVEIIDAKMNFAEMLEPAGDGPASKYKTKFIPEHISFTDYTGDLNRIEAMARFLVTPAEQNLKDFMTGMRSKLTWPLELANYDPQISSPPLNYGYNPPSYLQSEGTIRLPLAFLVLQCYLQQPCVERHAIGKPISAGSPTTPPEENDEEDEEKNEEGDPIVENDPWGSIPYPERIDKWSYAANSSIYTFSSMCSRYITDKLRVQLPVAGSIVRVTPVSVPDVGVQSEMSSRADITSPNSGYSNYTSKIFTLGGGQSQRIIDVDVERAGALPELPAPLDSYTDGEGNGITATLLRHWTDMHPPTLSADGITPIFRLTAHYVYGLSRPPQIGEELRMGVAPQTAFQRNDEEAKFQPSVVYGNQELDP